MEFVKNWKTTIGGLVCLASAVGLILKKLDVTGATLLASLGSTLIGITGSDSDSKTTNLVQTNTKIDNTSPNETEITKTEKSITS